MSLIERLGLAVPVIQAPMAGVSTPLLAATVSNAGGLGSIAVGATDAVGGRAMIDGVLALTNRAFNVNVFVHAAPTIDHCREAAWIDALRPLFNRFGAEPPAALRVIYKSFAQDDEMLALLVELRPPVVSFHFGLPSADRVAVLKAAGCMLLATATSLPEALAAKAAGVDAVVAQGYEAGGHRGMFDPDAVDACLGTLALTRLLVLHAGLPVIAAGGIMDGRGIHAALDLGAVAAQLGTAFIACPESSADEAYRRALSGPSAAHTVMTRAISGRQARGLVNPFTQWAGAMDLTPPDYPIAYDAFKALTGAAKAAGDDSYGAHWAGQGAPLSRVMPAGELVGLLDREAQRAA